MANNLQGGSGIYNGGAAVFNSAPHTQLLINLMARQNAKNDALDEYYRKLPSTITTTGMNNNDIPAFNKSLSDWQQDYVKNKAAILNPRLDGGKAQIQNQQLFRQTQSIPQESISEQKKIQPLNNMMADPDKRDRMTDGIFNDIHTHNLPLYVPDKDGNLIRNPERKSIDMTKLDFEGKPFDLAKHDTNFAHIPQTENTPTITNDPLHPDSQIVSTVKGYGKDAQKAIGLTSEFLYRNDSTFKSVIDDEIKKSSADPNYYNQLNSIYKNTFGSDLDIKHPEEFAAAWDISRKLTTAAKQTVQPNQSAIKNSQQEFELKRDRINHGFQAYLHTLPTYGELQKDKETTLGANSVLSSVSSMVGKPISNDFQTARKGLGMDTDNTVEVNDPSIKEHFKGLSTITKNSANKIEYNPKTNMMNLVFHNTDEEGNVTEEKIPYDPKEYLTDKVKQLNPNKDIGKLNEIVLGYYHQNGDNLLKTIQNFSGQQPTTQSKTEVAPSTLNASHWKKNKK